MQQGKGQSAYMKIFLEIADDIANGIYKVGDVIPTQLELASAYQVSRVTVREAIKELTRRGVVATQKGKGTVVIGNLFRAVDYQRVEGFSKVDAPEEGPQPQAPSPASSKTASSPPRRPSPGTSRCRRARCCARSSVSAASTA